MCPKGDDPLTVNQNYRQVQLSINTHVASGEVGLKYAGQVAYISLTNPGICGTSLSNTGAFGYVGCTVAQSSDSFGSYTVYTYTFTLTFYSWPTFPKENNLYSSNGNPSIYDFFCDITYADSTTYCIFTDIVSSNIRGVCKYNFFYDINDRYFCFLVQNMRFAPIEEPATSPRDCALVWTASAARPAVTSPTCTTTAPTPSPAWRSP